MTSSSRSVGIVLVFLLTNCDLPQSSSASKGQIQELVKQFADSTQRDVNAMLAMYEQGPETVSIGNSEIQRGMEAIRKNADANLVPALGKFKYDLGSIDVTLLEGGYALAITPFVVTENTSSPFARQLKGASTLLWKKTKDGWKIIHEHESLQP
jgi:ketosteroid isomerase-like protein